MEKAQYVSHPEIASFLFFSPDYLGD